MPEAQQRARRAAGPAPGGGPSRLLVVVAAAVVVAVIVAGAALWATLPRTSVAAPAAAPSSPPPSVASDGDRAEAERQLVNCRLKVSAGDRVLAESRTVLAAWSEHLRATSDFDAGSTTFEQRGTTWDRTAASAGPALARRKSALDEWQRTVDCQWVAGAPADLGSRLDACSLRLTMMRRAIENSDRPVSDWTRHLKEEGAHAAQPATRGDWERSWLGSRYTLDEWQDADTKYASAPDCR